MTKTLPKVIEFVAPVRIESEMNRREHWAKRKKRFDRQRDDIRIAWLFDTRPSLRADVRSGATFVVTLTRIGPRRLDTDNLASGMKRAQDTVADILGVDDGAANVRWRYEQRKGEPKEFAIHVRIESTEVEGDRG